MLGKLRQDGRVTTAFRFRHPYGTELGCYEISSDVTVGGIRTLEGTVNVAPPIITHPCKRGVLPITIYMGLALLVVYEEYYITLDRSGLRTAAEVTRGAAFPSNVRCHYHNTPHKPEFFGFGGVRQKSVIWMY